jgi:outer membrane lipoprotein SlyB
MEKPKCPSCGGSYMVPKNNAQRVGTIVGGILGVAGRLGSVIGGPAGAVAALLAGALTGQKVGQVIDDHVIRSFRCTKCGKEINL